MYRIACGHAAIAASLMRHRGNRRWYDSTVISEPDDYGMSPEQTLAHTANVRPPRDFDRYWSDTRDALLHLSPRWQGTLDGPINEVVMESSRSVRIVGRLTLPSKTPRGAVITTHGYDTPDEWPGEDEPWSQHNLATLRLRVRGYPPSTMDTGDLRSGWIVRGIESPDAWILRGAIIDLIHAYRCLRTRFGEGFPIALHGESFGGGLAVIAAAQLTAMNDPPHRLILGLPTFGDWRWRRGRYCNGSGHEVNVFLETMRDEASVIMRTLLLFDTTLHAQNITMPTLCKLALRDDDVPSPSAAAVFNAIASPDKWRFITRFGHCEGGLADLRRHAQFERLHPAFADPLHKPDVLVARSEIKFDPPCQVSCCKPASLKAD